MKPLLFKIAPFLLIGICSPLFAQTIPPDPSEGGPAEAVSAEYGKTDPLVMIQGVPYPVQTWGKVWFPFALSGGPYPLVIVLHGNHGICRSVVGTPPMNSDECAPDPPVCPAATVATPNHEGYDYFAQRLASWGYIVASINANAINCRANGLTERGRLVIAHLRKWVAWNSAAGAPPFGTLFSGKVDLSRVSLVGHSRGGEGVRAAYNISQGFAVKPPWTIVAVEELAPTDCGRGVLNDYCPAYDMAAAPPVPKQYDAFDVNYSVLLPGCDGDLYLNPGMRVFDRAQSHKDTAETSRPKAQQFVWGAGHNFLNSQWDENDISCNPDGNQKAIDRPAEQMIGQVYVMGFVRDYVGGEKQFHYLFTGDKAPPPLTVQTPVFNAYNESRPKTLLIDDFTASDSPDFNTAGGKNTWANLTVASCFSVGDPQGCDKESRPANPKENYWKHDKDKHAGKIIWGDKDGKPSFSLQVAPNGAPVDVSAYQYLSFRVAEQNDTVLNPAFDDSQDFYVGLVDNKGVKHFVNLASYRKLWPPQGVCLPKSGPPYDYCDLKSVLSTTRIPLSAFNAVNLKAIVQIEYDFDLTGFATGAIFLSDIHFSP